MDHWALYNKVSHQGREIPIVVYTDSHVLGYPLAKHMVLASVDNIMAPQHQSGTLWGKWGSRGPTGDALWTTQRQVSSLQGPLSFKEQQPTKSGLIVSTKAIALGSSQKNVLRNKVVKNKEMWVISKDNLRFTHWLLIKVAIWVRQGVAFKIRPIGTMIL